MGREKSVKTMTESISQEHKNQKLNLENDFVNENFLEFNSDTSCGFWIFNGPAWQL